MLGPLRFEEADYHYFENILGRQLSEKEIYFLENILDLWLQKRTLLSGYFIDEECNLFSNEQNHNYVYFTPLVIDSFDDCGPHGPIAFRYKIRDYSNFITYSEEFIMQICWPGECE